jgi:hypothetical protein
MAKPIAMHRDANQVHAIWVSKGMDPNGQQSRLERVRRDFSFQIQRLSTFAALLRIRDRMCP